MSDPKLPEPVKLVVSFFSGDGGLLREALQVLSQKYGRADFVSAPLPFDYTDYYAKEFGGGLIRRLVAFEALVRPESLPEIKLWTNGLEARLGSEGARRVNIDPGYLSMAHLILATGKGYTHRPHLRDGIYADLTLVFRERTFHPLPWTYPDYASPGMIEMLIRIRRKYLLQLKTSAGGGPDLGAAAPAEESND